MDNEKKVCISQKMGQIEFLGNFINYRDNKEKFWETQGKEIILLDSENQKNNFENTDM